MTNKERFIQLLRDNVRRDGLDALLDWLETTDFYTAPASSRFHCACPEGLLLHSLNVYDVLMEKHFDPAEDNPESAALCALLHDLCKAQFYKVSSRNVKNEQTGAWEKVPYYAIEDMNAACKEFSAAGVRYRTGKTLVPFRLTGNIEWGVASPRLEGEEQQTVWVWPESLWAPISFTETYLQRRGIGREHWKDYWCSRDARVYQFIGQDNIYFYGIAQTGMGLLLSAKGAEEWPPANAEQNKKTGFAPSMTATASGYWPMAMAPTVARAIKKFSSNSSPCSTPSPARRSTS